MSCWSVMVLVPGCSGSDVNFDESVTIVTSHALPTPPPGSAFTVVCLNLSELRNSLRLLFTIARLRSAPSLSLYHHMHLHFS
jgi:hypothetical protein